MIVCVPYVTILYLIQLYGFRQGKCEPRRGAAVLNAAPGANALGEQCGSILCENSPCQLFQTIQDQPYQQGNKQQTQ